MKVFAVFSERKAGLIKVWSRSWEAHGWTPQLISSKELAVMGSVRAAARARGGGLLADLQVINFDYPSRKRPRRRILAYGCPGWEKARLVQFPSEATEEDVQKCGRPLWD